MGYRTTIIKREVLLPEEPSTEFIAESLVLSTTGTYYITALVMIPLVVAMIAFFAVQALVLFLIGGTALFGLGEVQVASMGQTNTVGAYAVMTGWLAFSSYFVYEGIDLLKGLVSRWRYAGKMRKS